MDIWDKRISDIKDKDMTTFGDACGSRMSWERLPNGSMRVSFDQMPGFEKTMEFSSHTFALPEGADLKLRDVMVEACRIRTKMAREGGWPEPEKMKAFNEHWAGKTDEPGLMGTGSPVWKAGEALPFSKRLMGLAGKSFASDLGTPTDSRLMASSVALPFAVGFAVGGPIGAGLLGMANLVGANIIGHTVTTMGLASAGALALMVEKTVAFVKEKKASESSVLSGFSSLAERLDSSRKKETNGAPSVSGRSGPAA